MFCRVYCLFEECQLRYYLHGIAKALKAVVEDDRYIEMPGYSVEMRINGKRNVIKSKNYPDGFLYFPYSVEIDIQDFITEEQAATDVNKILLFLWGNKCPAIASCSFESLLVLKGGYRSKEDFEFQL